MEFCPRSDRRVFLSQHAGDYVGACEALQEAQSLDTADRYVNSKAASYLLAAGRIAAAEEMCSKFTRVGHEVAFFLFLAGEEGPLSRFVCKVALLRL